MKSESLSCILDHHRFEIARRWAECYFEDFRDHHLYPKEQLICAVMTVLQQIRRIEQTKSGSEPERPARLDVSLDEGTPALLLHRLCDVGSGHCDELLEEIGELSARHDFSKLCESAWKTVGQS